MNILKHTPIHEIAKQLNAHFATQNGWQIPEHYGQVENELEATRQDVVLVDQSHNGKIQVEGATAGAFLKGDDLTINAGIPTPHGHIFRLRQDLFFITTSNDNLAEQLTNQAKSSADLITVTDVTHGNAELWLVGPKSKAVLSRVCGLDFDDNQFPKMTTKQSSVAKTKQLIIRRDVGEVPAFSLIGSRSYGAYLWQTIMEAGQDLGIMPAGAAILNQLKN